jgi:hypothetical protein
MNKFFAWIRSTINYDDLGFVTQLQNAHDSGHSTMESNLRQTAKDFNLTIPGEDNV